MMSGHVQGKLLEILSRLLTPEYVLEIGTFTGYSAVCLASGLRENGELHTIEVRAEEAAKARSYFNETQPGNRIILHEGNALEILQQLHRPWDIVFIDADKTGYTEYFKLVLPYVRKGGLILADNVLFHGQVLQDPVSGKSAKAIQEFNDYVQQEQLVENVMLTVRDGLMMIYKK